MTPKNEGPLRHVSLLEDADVDQVFRRLEDLYRFCVDVLIRRPPRLQVRMPPATVAAGDMPPWETRRGGGEGEQQ